MARKEIQDIIKEQEIQEKIVKDFINLIKEDKLEELINNSRPKGGNYLVNLSRKFEGYIGFFCNDYITYYVDTRTDYIIIRKQGLYIKDILPEEVSLKIYNYFKNEYENYNK